MLMVSDVMVGSNCYAWNKLQLFYFSNFSIGNLVSMLIY